MTNINCKTKEKNLNVRRKNELLFYSIMMIFPVIQVIIFYFVINFNSIILAFEEYSYGIDGAAGYTFAGFKNFNRCFYELFNDFSLNAAFTNSTIAFGVQTLVLPWLALLFSYYIYKNRFGAKLFNIFLFLPSIISPLVITLIYKVVLEDALPAIILQVFGTKVMPIYSAHTMASLLIYYIFTSFGTSVLLYTSAMAGIDQSLIEAADLDGATGIKGFYYIVFPLVYPTFVTFIIVGFSSYFVNQLNLYSFESGGAEKKFYTYGYWLYTKTVTGTLSDYTYLSAMGILFTLVAIPLTFTARYLLNKFGPSVD